jgi:hypothetical protein
LREVLLKIRIGQGDEVGVADMEMFVKGFEESSEEGSEKGELRSGKISRGLFGQLNLSRMSRMMMLMLMMLMTVSTTRLALRERRSKVEPCTGLLQGNEVREKGTEVGKSGQRKAVMRWATAVNLKGRRCSRWRQSRDWSCLLWC